MQLRHKLGSTSVRADRPLVGIAVDGTTGYGRGVMRGVMRYANLQRRWLIHEQMRGDTKKEWPQCDGAIIAGLSRNSYDKVVDRSRHVVHCSGTLISQS